MSRYIDIAFTCPPSIDFPQYVETRDAEGQQLAVGEWLAPDAGTPLWRLRLTPAELLQQLIADQQATATPAGAPGIARDIRRTQPAAQNVIDPQAARRAAKERAAADRIADLAKKSAAKPAGPPAKWSACPGCNQPSDPSVESFLCGGGCGSLCRACVPSPNALCPACSALVADAEEGGFDPSADPLANEGMLPGGNRLFDGVHHGRTGDSAPAEEED